MKTKRHLALAIVFCMMLSAFGFTAYADAPVDKDAKRAADITAVNLADLGAPPPVTYCRGR